MPEAATETAKGVIVKSVKHRETKEKVVFEFDYGSTLQEAIELFGEEVVHANYLVGAATSARNRLYNLVCEENKNDEIMTAEQALEIMSTWKPGIGSSRTRKSKVEKAVDATKDMTAEQRQALIEHLMSAIEDSDEDED